MKKLNLRLVGLDGNAFVLLGNFRKKAQSSGWTDEEIEKVLTEAKSGDYSHLLNVLSSYCKNGGFQGSVNDRGDVMGCFICVKCDGMFDSHNGCEEYKESLICPDCYQELWEEGIHPKCGSKLMNFSGNENMPAGQFCPKCNDEIYDENGEVLARLT